MPKETAPIQARFAAAVDRFVARAEQDPYVIAAILAGSFSHDSASVWEKSDIDLVVVTRDEKIHSGNRLKRSSVALVEEGLNLHLWMQTRGEFRKTMDGSIRGSFIHSLLSKSRLLFTRDQTIKELYENLKHLGSRDQQVNLLRAACMAVPILYKAEKWLHVKDDTRYSFLWIMGCVQALAQIEVALAGEIAEREVIQQALKINPTFFDAIYTDLIDKKKTQREVAGALEKIDQYLSRKTRVLFGPILDFLRDAGAVRSASEIETHFSNQYGVSQVTTACEWLADKDVIAKVSSPVRLTDKSKVEFDEMAFYYDGEPDR